MTIFTTHWLSAIFEDDHGENLMDLPINEVTTDSRKETENALFVPIKGEKFNGHHFLKEAYDHGAVAVLWEESEPLPAFLPSDFPVFFVQDTLKALQILAQSYRNKVNPIVIGITGSNGKTTTKDIVTTLLKERYRTHATQGNFNNHIGLPLTILTMNPATEMLVLEMGMNHFNEIDLLSRIAEPNYAIITNIGESHIEFLGSRQGIAQAKLEIIHGLKSGGTLIIDGDEELLEQIDGANNIIKCGFKQENDYLIDEVSVESDHTEFRLDGEENYGIPLLGKHHAKNTSYAIALGKELGLKQDEMKTSLKKISLTGMRFEMSQGKNGVSIINDAYNASPTSMKAAIEVVKEMPGFAEKILILGDIFELGEQSREMHEAIADSIEEPITALFTIGENIKATHLQLKKDRPNITNCFYDSKEQLICDLQPYLNHETLLLFKASRLMEFESLIERLQTTDE